MTRRRRRKKRKGGGEEKQEIERNYEDPQMAGKAK